MTKPKSRRLAAIMFTDIVGYTTMMQEDEARAVAVRTKHRQVFEEDHARHGGEILQYYGDGTLSIFHSAIQAVECAIAIQQRLSGDQGVPLRIGIHIGDIITDGTEIYGDGVNIASRIENLCTAGAILISGKLNEELQNQKHLSSVSMGRFSLKNVAKPLEVFALDQPGLHLPTKDELKQPPFAPKHTIAVLPFVNMSSNPETEYFSDGMTEEIINALAKIKTLKVTSRTSSFHFKGQNLPIRHIGQELNVATILEGSIRLSGKRMRLTAQLIDVQEDFHFWSETFDRTMEDIFAVQDEISLLIADKLREHTGHFEIEEHLVEAPEIVTDAYQQYLKGRFYILKMSRGSILQGIQLMEEVIATQPHYALAYLGVHLGYTMLATLGLEPAQEAFAKAYPYLQKAVALDASLPECQLQLSYIALLQDWDLTQTYEHLARAFDIRLSVEYYQSMASTLACEGKQKAAMGYIDIALQLDPYSAINAHLKGFIYYVERNYDLSIIWFDKSQKSKSKFLVSTLYLGQALLLSGREKEALAYYEGLEGDQAADLMKVGGITLAHAMMNNRAAATAVVAELEAALETELMDKALNLLIMIYARLGEEERALALIAQGIENRLPMMIFLREEPMLQPLWDNVAYQELMAQVLDPSGIERPSERKYKKTLLDDELTTEYKARLETLMEEKQPYLDPQLTLRGLAAQMDISPNQLSQLLNEGFDRNFSEFVNSYRLSEFKSKVGNDGLQHLTLLALAYDSGFNSKTVFNTFFKKSTGMTPKAYWKSVRHQ